MSSFRLVPTVLRHRDCIAVGEARIYLARGSQPAAESMRPSGPPTREFQPPEIGHDDRTLRAPPMWVLRVASYG